MPARIVLYIACSLDGFIARPNGSLDWLTSFPAPDGSDYGYTDFLKTVGVNLIGRTTYEEVLGFDIEWPYEGMQTYVFSNNSDYKVATPDTVLFEGDFVSGVHSIRSAAEKDIWLIGGGKLIHQFMKFRMIDRMIITYIPVILGSGIPLFTGDHPEVWFNLINAESFSTGAVTMTYEQKLQE